MALFPRQLEELWLARVTRVEDAPDDHDLGSFGSDPLPDIGVVSCSGDESGCARFVFNPDWKWRYAADQR